MSYPLALLLLLAALWIACMIRPADRAVWATENTLTLAFVALAVWMYPRWPSSNLSYTLVFAFLILHTVGGHYTYAKVPYDRWCARLTGRELTQVLRLTRNHYDRVVHFAFGLLFAYPTYEFGSRHAQARGAWNYVLAWCLVVAASAVFELMEWAVATLLGGGAGQDYLAAQGDEWDAQKDMALATLGATVTLIATALA